MERYSLSLYAPAEDWTKITVRDSDGNALIVLDRESAELLVRQLVTLIDAFKALEAIDDGDDNGESAS